MILNTAIKAFSKGKVDKRSKLTGKINIGKGTIVENSIIRGPVIIGENCRIENSYLGPYTSVNNNCTIQDCEIENSIVLGSVKIIGVEKRIDSSLLGWNSDVGTMGNYRTCISLFIGDESMVKL